jgi:hypothetical protein
LGGNLLLAKYTRILLERGVKPHQIGIIVQSFAERSMLSILLDPICTKIGIDRKNLVIGSEFDFVGRELSREVILKSDLSLDDSNSLSVSLYPHRLSASLLTASRQLFIVGRESHFKKEEMFELNNFMQLVREKGTIMAPDDLVSTVTSYFLISDHFNLF